jgi:hypothetical protein
MDIRPIGGDVSVGEVVLKKGEKIGASEIGLLATVGMLSPFILNYRPLTHNFFDYFTIKRNNRGARLCFP